MGPNRKLVALVLGCVGALLTLAPRIPRNFQPPTVSALPTTTCTLDEVVILNADSLWYRCTTASPAAWTPMDTTGAGGGDPATLTKCINVDPASTVTSWLFFKSKAAITVTAIDCIVDAATSVVMTLRECDANAANCTDMEAAITCATTNSPHSGGIDDAAVDSGDWMRVTRGTVTGTITQASLCMTYTEP